MTNSYTANIPLRSVGSPPLSSDPPYIRRRAIVFHPMSGTSGLTELLGPADDFLSVRHVRDDNVGVKWTRFYIDGPSWTTSA